jgi:hypothetical protein
LQTQMPHKRTRVDVPDHRDLVPVQVQLRRFGRSPVR